MDKIRIGISACLLGEQVRYDGGHKLSQYATVEMAPFFEFVPTCPEMAIGMGAPRKTIRLVDNQGLIQIKSADNSVNVTEPLNQYAAEKVETMQDLGGYLLCAKSPTCGMERVSVYREGTQFAEKTGVGVFARHLMERFPLLPVEETGRLHDMAIRENFFTRIYAYEEWRQWAKKGWTAHRLTQFHARYKYLLMAHDPEGYRKLGPLLAQKSDDIDALAAQYQIGFMTVLKTQATRKNHSNTLQHIQGYFKKHITAADKAELNEAIDQYRLGLQPLLVPITLINHHLRHFPEPYIQDQVYLNPHPQGLKLRYAF
jgi:uncharacterized protein YbgA (DUF1722 family)/uncharacterized protein YbbK (DUF523 family)